LFRGRGEEGMGLLATKKKGGTRVLGAENLQIRKKKREGGPAPRQGWGEKRAEVALDKGEKRSGGKHHGVAKS